MRRRSLLASLGGLAAGCTGISAPGTSTRSPYQEYRVTGVSVTTSNEEYVLRTTRFYTAEGIEAERAESEEPVVVRNVSEIDPPGVREAIETAIREEEWGSDELTDGLDDLVKRVDFFTGISTDWPYTHFGVELSRSPAALAFDASVADRRVSLGDRGVVECSLTNTSDETVAVKSGVIVPFGTLKAKRRTDGGEFLLWHDYEGYGDVDVSSDGVVAPLIQVQTPTNPGETISRRYEILPPTTTLFPELTAPPGPGDYRVSGRVDLVSGEDLAYGIEFTLEPP
ncbi:MAG: hypothetical protein ABEH66_02600 [Halobacteriales archaeon]